MTREKTNTLIGVLGCLVVALMIAVISILSFNPLSEPLRAGGVNPSEQISYTAPSQAFARYSISSALRLNNSPYSPEAAF